MTTPVFICCLSVRQWNCFRSPVSTSKERSSSTTELRSSTRTSPPQRRAWWEITWTYPTWIWRVPGSSWRGLWWVSRYKLTLTSRKAESDLWNSAASPSPSSTVASVCEYIDLHCCCYLWTYTSESILDEEFIILTVQKEFHRVSCGRRHLSNSSSDVMPAP